MLIKNTTDALKQVMYPEYLDECKYLVNLQYKYDELKSYHREYNNMSQSELYMKRVNHEYNVVASIVYIILGKMYRISLTMGIEMDKFLKKIHGSGEGIDENEKKKLNDLIRTLVQECEE